MSNIITSIYTFLLTYKVAIISVIVVLVLVSLAIVFRKKIYKLIVDAETGALTAIGLSQTIEKIQRSDLDDRMVLVIAKIITSLPVLKLLPTTLVVKFLNTIVQRVFDSVKSLLDAKAKTLMAKTRTEDETLRRYEELSNLVGDDIDSIVNNLKLYGMITLTNKTAEAFSGGSVNVSKKVDEVFEKTEDILGAKLDNIVENLDKLSGELDGLDIGKVFGE